MTQILEQDSSVNPYILTNIQGPFNDRWKIKGWKVFVSDIKWGSSRSSQGKLSKILDMAKSNYLAFKLLKKYRLPVLYCNDIQGYWCAYFGGKMAGRKIIFNLRDTKSADELFSLKKWQYIAQHADTIVVLSQEMKDFVVQKLLTDAKKVIVSYSIVNHQMFKPVSHDEKLKKRKLYAVASNDFVISYVATFNEKKAQLPFIKNVIAGFKNNEGVKFYFIGDFDTVKNPYAAECLAAVKELGLESMVTFLGHINNVDEYYKMSDLVAIASTKEGLARCMIEAISCGTPVISFDVCSAKEILTDGHSGEVVKMGDYAGFTQKIKDLMGNKELMQQYGANGVKLSAELFDKEQVLSRYDAVYPELQES